MKKKNDLLVCAVLEKRLLLMCIAFAVFLFIVIKMSELNTKKTDELIQKSASTRYYENVVAITFDDGPHRDNTTVLLDGLKERGVVATFFVVGERINGNEDIIKRMYEEGHVIGNHTFSHVKLDEMELSEACEEIKKTNRLIEEITGEKTKYIRPPYGAFSEKMECSIDMTEVLWSVDPCDWNTKNVRSVVKNVVANVKDGDIILLHDIYETSVAAALEIIDELKNKGFYFVTIEDILIQ